MAKQQTLQTQPFIKKSLYFSLQDICICTALTLHLQKGLIIIEKKGEATMNINLQNRSIFFYGRVLFGILAAIFLLLLIFKKSTTIAPSLFALGMMDAIHAIDLWVQQDKNKAIGVGMFGLLFIGFGFFWL
jgi:hypothetical protein